VHLLNFHVVLVSVLAIRIRVLLGLLDPDLGFTLPSGSKDPDPKEIITDTQHRLGTFCFKVLRLEHISVIRSRYLIV
jgi:hypothetical protein